MFPVLSHGVFLFIKVSNIIKWLKISSLRVAVSHRHSLASTCSSDYPITVLTPDFYYCMMTKPIYYYNSTYCCFSITLPEPELQLTSKLTILINIEGLSDTLWPNKEHHSITVSWVLIIEEKNIITSQEGPLGFFALTRQTESTGIFVLCKAVIRHSGASENAHTQYTPMLRCC